MSTCPAFHPNKDDAPCVHDLNHPLPHRCEPPMSEPAEWYGDERDLAYECDGSGVIDARTSAGDQDWDSCPGCPQCKPVADGVERIARERATHPGRGYTVEHDRQHDAGELIVTAVNLLTPALAPPDDRSLVVAGSLIAAELDRRKAAHVQAD